ncbi:peptidyl-prolyl cis-trans isomerase D [Syntrophus gentianae]|uniref:Periplasmic chaperone PpiD n=1 Tax=Syntrophus gentianae TaxID=43775 RepID=A0A1H7X418_9BACT|nr:peptidylprolyl isomerase [Syntrophus gentianae]SEM27947.1 peptidyl-prolyl cis-trans isomerase D [Syntrophus gentianae]
MLELMRKHAKNWLMKFLLGMIVIVFIFYFGTRRGEDETKAVATVNGQDIALAQVQKEYSDLVELYLQQYGSSLSEEMLKGLDLKQKALDILINKTILLQKAQELNIAATEDEVRNYIMAYPAFQRGGAFNEMVYQRMLRMNRMTPEVFEAEQQKMLSAAKLEQLISEAVKVCDQEVFDFFRFQNEQINLSYLMFNPASFKDSIAPSRKDLETYLKEHGSEFRVPEQVQLKALFFPARDYAAAAKISDAEIADYYERHSSKFAQKGEKAPPLAEVKTRIVQELTQISGMAAAEEAAKKAHDAIYQQENFDGYAAQNKLKIVTTDFFPLNSIPAPFNKAANFPQVVMDLKKGEISKVLSGEGEYFVIQVAARKPAYIPELKTVEQEVAKRYSEMAARSLCKKTADTMLARLKKGESLNQIAQANKLSVEETGFFKPGGAIPKLGANPQLSMAIYQLAERTPLPESTFEVNGSFVIVFFKERGKMDTTDYDSKKENLKKLLLQAKRNEYFTTWLENTKALMIKEGKLKIKKDFKEL